jgi:hypothetical protein
MKPADLPPLLRFLLYAPDNEVAHVVVPKTPHDDAGRDAYVQGYRQALFDLRAAVRDQDAVDAALEPPPS